jgi:DNA invertase Pin-like site-specific DNA recombinase
VFEDNNISGYTLDRPGFNKLKELIEAGQMDTLLVKDLSRVGRHNAKVLLFLDYLVDMNVRLVLMTDNYDSQTDDDTIIGIKTWYNELYLKDLSKKITANMRQKQREGLVIVEPYGYIKTPNNKNKLLIDEPAAQIVRQIFGWYLDGMGCSSIAHRLNAMGVITPSMQKFNRQGFGWKPEWRHKDKWSPTGIKRILINDAYTGTLRCGVSRTPRLRGKRGKVPRDQHFVHENFMEAIISREVFDEAQMIFAQRTKNHQHTCQNQKVHRYAGLLRCGDCENGFTARTRRDKRGNRVGVVYNCNTYYRFGKQHCTVHSVHETAIDEAVFGILEALLRDGSLCLEEIERRIDEDTILPSTMEEQRVKLEARIAAKKEEMKDYARQCARRLIDEELFEELSLEARDEITVMERKLALCVVEARDPEAEKRQAQDCFERLERIIGSREMTQADIATLIDHIDVHDTGMIGAYNVREVRLTVIWNIPELGMMVEMAESVLTESVP